MKYSEIRELTECSSGQHQEREGGGDSKIPETTSQRNSEWMDSSHRIRILRMKKPKVWLKILVILISFVSLIILLNYLLVTSLSIVTGSSEDSVSTEEPGKNLVLFLY